MSVPAVGRKLPLLSSQDSVSSSGGTPRNITPITHRRLSQLRGDGFDSPLASPMLSDVINDDDKEKRRRLKARLSDVAQKHMTSPASESKNKSGASNLSGWNATQISEHLEDCIQLSKDNKINFKNAFQLHLLDSLKAMLKKDKETNFQMAGASLEAGAKIYASRVDALHLQAIQVHDKISQLDNDGEVRADGGVGGEGSPNMDDQSAGPQKKKATRRKKDVIESDVDKLDFCNDVDQLIEIDPLLLKLSKEDDSSFGGWLLSALRSADDEAYLMLHTMSNPLPNPNINLKNCLSDELELPELGSIDGRVLCPSFDLFQFNQSGQHPIFESLNKRPEDLKFDPDKDVSYSEDAAGYADFPGDDGDYQNNEGVNDKDKSDEYIEYRTAHSAVTGTVSQITDGSITSLLSMVNVSSSEYSFFGTMKNMWAGPSHWKAGRMAAGGVKRPGETISCVTKKQAKEKQQFFIDFEAEINFEKKSKKTRAATTVTKTTLDRYKKQPLLLPEDLHYDSKDLLKLFTKSQYLTLLNAEQNAAQAASDDGDDNDYNYYNKNDVDNYCADVSGGNFDDEGCNDYQGSMLSQQPTILNFDDTLVAQPALVEGIEILYATRPKKVDFKRLKRNMWNLITDKPQKENRSVVDEDTVIKDGTSFHYVYDKLPNLCPSYEAKDLSVPIAFVALLHMCNEKNLKLESSESFHDLRIFAGVE